MHQKNLEFDDFDAPPHENAGSSASYLISFTSVFLFTQISNMMFARVFALSCLALGAEAFFMGTPLRTSMRVGSSRTSLSMKVPTDHPEIEVR